MENTGIARPDLAAANVQSHATTPAVSEKNSVSDSEAAKEPQEQEPPARNVHGWKVSAFLTPIESNAVSNSCL